MGKKIKALQIALITGALCAKTVQVHSKAKSNRPRNRSSMVQRVDYNLDNGIYKSKKKDRDIVTEAVEHWKRRRGRSEYNKI